MLIRYYESGHHAQHTTLLESLRKNYDDKLNQLEGPNAWNVICDIFKAVTGDEAMLDPVCIVDALDECEHNCKALLKLIVNTSAHVKWLLSSRNVKDIERDLRKIESNRILSLELKANAENISKSVDAYINNSIQDIEALEDDIELQMQTTETLKRKANGTFLWVALVIEQLRDTDRRNIEDVLKEIPAGLESLYQLIMERVNSKLRPKDQEACRVLLSIIITAERPLHLKELYLFMSSQWADHKATYDIRDIQDIVKDLSSLLYTRDDTVYFIHQSVKDYMVDYATTRIFPLGIEYQHYQMAKTSLEAMSQILKYDICNLKNPGSELRWLPQIFNQQIPDQQIPDQLRSVAYSCIYWVEHLVRGCSSGGPTAEDLSKDDGILHSFLTVKYLCWLESLALLRSLESHGAKAIEKFKILYTSSYGNKSDEYHLIGLKGDTNFLKRFIGDAHDFFHSCKDYVKNWPLQLYYSAIIFENESSTIHKTFRRSVQAHFGNSFAHFGNSFTILKRPRMRFSLRHTLRAQHSIDDLFYSRDSSALCVLSSYPNDQTFVVYRTDTMEKMFEWTMSNNYRYYVSFLPDSEHLISVSSTGIVQTWAIDSRTQKQRRSSNLDLNKLQIDYPSGKVPQEQVISLSPRGDLAASTCLTRFGNNVSLVKIWTTQTCACACQIDLMHTPTKCNELGVIFSPNSTLIALIHEDDVRIYSIQTGEEIAHIQAPNNISVAYKQCSKFSEDSELLALVHEKGYEGADIYLWCSKTWTMTHWIKLDTQINDIGLSPDASLFIVASGDILIVGSTETGQQLYNITPGRKTENIWKVLFSPDWPNSSLLASAHSGEVRISRADARHIADGLQNTAHPPSSVTISPGSKYVAAQSLGGCINIWSGDSGESVQVLRGGDRSQGWPLFSPNSELIACEDEGQADVRIWRVDTGESIHKLQGPYIPRESLYRLHKMFSDDSKYLFIAYAGFEAKVWCVDSGECLFETDRSALEYLTRRLVGLAISLDSKYLAVACSSHTQPWEVRIWDWRMGHRVSTLLQPAGDYMYRGHIILSRKSDIRVAFSSDATALAVICRLRHDNYEVQIWEVATGIRLARVAAGKSYSFPLFNPTTNQILTDRAVFCKKSSWDCWDKISQLPRRRYSVGWDSGRPWLCCNGEMICRIPYTPQLMPAERQSEAVSDSLLAYATPVREIVIIRLPSL